MNVNVSNELMHDMGNELMGVMSGIWGNPRYRSEKKKLWRTIEAWKEVVSRYIAKASSPFELNVLYAIMGSVSYHLYDMEYEDALQYVIMIIKFIGGETYVKV